MPRMRGTMTAADPANTIKIRIKEDAARSGRRKMASPRRRKGEIAKIGRVARLPSTSRGREKLEISEAEISAGYEVRLSDVSS